MPINLQLLDLLDANAAYLKISIQLTKTAPHFCDRKVHKEGLRFATHNSVTLFKFVNSGIRIKIR